MSRVRNILLVCTGNSCRSVMAGGLLQKLLRGKGDYRIVTAGVAAIKGAAPTSEAIQVSQEQGIDVSAHRSLPLSEEMIDTADLILVMERRHKEDILQRRPEAADKVHLLTEFGRQKLEAKLVNPDVPDPIGKPIEFYRQVFAIIKESVMRAVKKLEEGDCLC